jgi:FkbM family methyltransferase
MVPSGLKRWMQGRRRGGRVARVLSPHLPPTVCVDVGASYYPHVRWGVFLNAPETRWLAVEPNEKNIGYVRDWPYACNIKACTTGLSQYGGTQTLYITNVESGSSLLPPVITAAMRHRVRNLGYYFPVTERLIKTLTLLEALGDLADGTPVCMKLDTQGTELSILKGAQTLFDERLIVGIEMEATLLAEPVMAGSGKFWQACQYLEAQGMELLHLNPIPAIGRRGRIAKGRNTYLNECDAVFALRPDLAADLPVERRASLLAFYTTNLFFEEALSLLERDSELDALLSRRGCDTGDLRAVLLASL